MHIDWVCVFERFLFALFGCNSHPPPVLKTTCIPFDWSGQCLALIVAVPDKRSGKYTCTQSNQNLRGNSTLSSTYTLHTIQDWKLYFGGERKKSKAAPFAKYIEILIWKMSLWKIHHPKRKTTSSALVLRFLPFFLRFRFLSLSLSFTRKNDHIQLVAIRRAYFLSFSFRIRNQVLFQLKCLSKIDNLLFSIIRFSSDFRQDL